MFQAQGVTQLLQQFLRHCLTPKRDWQYNLAVFLRIRRQLSVFYNITDGCHLREHCTACVAYYIVVVDQVLVELSASRRERLSS